MSRANKGDEVYFTHRGGTASGVVRSVGKHGCHVDAGKQRHKVKWAHLLGHKKRMSYPVRVVDQGDDGAMVEGSEGERRFVAGYSDDNQVDDAVSSEKDFPKALFFKGREGIANRPGLHQEEKTDKTGRREKRWVKNGESPTDKQQKHSSESEKRNNHHAPGDNVSFHADGKHKSGKVILSGKDGATVQDGEGKDHQIEWGNMSVGDETPKTGDTVKPDPFFSEENMELPESVSQDVTSKEELYKSAEQGLKELHGWLSGLADSHDWDSHLDDYKNALGKMKSGHEGVLLIVAPLKDQKRAGEKADNAKKKVGYKGKADGWDQVTDIVRGTVSVPKVDDLSKIMSLLHKSGMELVKKPKNRFSKPTPEGYRDIMMNVRLQSGHIAELQVSVHSMMVAKDAGHVHFEKIRPITEAAEKERRSMTVEEAKVVEHETKASMVLYGKAWKMANGINGIPLKKSAILFYVRR